MTSSELTADRPSCTVGDSPAKVASIIYLAPDCTDSAVRKRVEGLLELGHQLTTFAFRRDRYNVGRPCPWDHVELGKSRERHLVSRLLFFWQALWIIYGHRARWRESTIIWARNLDLALLGFMGRLITRSNASLVYEVLDIHPVLVKRNWQGSVARWLERIVLARCKGLVISSPEFAKQYFSAYQGYHGKTYLVENKWSPVGVFARPGIVSSRPAGKTRCWSIGWFGNLRCSRSLTILTQVARDLPDRVQIYLRGFASLLGEQVLQDAIASCDNIHFEGEYDAPNDLPEIYGRVHFNWCADLSDGLNSRWLIPNRVYEGGYFGVPALAVDGYYVGEVVQSRGLGFTLQEATAECLKDLILAMDSTTYDECRRQIEALPQSDFTGSHELADVVAACAK